MTWNVRAARREDDAALRALVARTPMGQRPVVVHERVPSFFALNQLRGGATYVVEEEGAIVACGTWSKHVAWLAGTMQEVGHVSDVRVATTHRARGLARALAEHGLGQAHELHGVTTSTMATLTSNLLAKRAALRHAGTQHQGSYTMVNLPWRRSVLAEGVRQADQGDISDIGELLAETQARRHFGWHLDAHVLRERLQAWPGLAITDFVVAERGRRLIGCAAAWDPHPVRQTRVRSWGARLGAYRMVQAPVAWRRGGAALPAAGGLLRMPYLTHVGLETDDPGLLRALALGAMAVVPGGPPPHALAVMMPHEVGLGGALRGLGASVLKVELLSSSSAGTIAGLRGAGGVGIEMALA